MIRFIKGEPVIKFLATSIIVILTLSYAGLILIQVNQLDKIHKDEIKTFQGIVGTLIESYPEKESEIVKKVFDTNKLQSNELGGKVLKKYGYHSKLAISNDERFIDYRKNMIGKNIILVGCLLVLNLVFFIVIWRIVIRYFSSVLNTINDFIKGDYTNREYSLSEGVIAKVYGELNHLGNNIAAKEAKLVYEKEISKVLVTDISHQLKTPLASLKICNAILLERGLEEEEQVEFLLRSKDEIKKLEDLIGSLVNISRLEVNMIKINPVNTSIKETLIKSINGVYMRALDKEIDIEVEEFEDIIIPHDNKWTSEAIFNILENAVKYTNVRGKINVYVSNNINYIKIEIIDNGIGIKKEDFNNIFKRFFRGKSNNIEGSGIGLYLSRKIIEEQGGSILVKSKEGVGSIFSILLRKR